MGEHNSPFFAAGREDGRRDAQAARSCPPGRVTGMDPGREWSSMYRRGYEREFDGRVHSCPNCEGLR